jgi:hypothetical protein
MKPLTGIEIQRNLHVLAVHWVFAAAGTVSGDWQKSLLRLAHRFFCEDMLSEAALNKMVRADVIFCNNLLFSGDAKDPSRNLNGKLAVQLEKLATRLVFRQVVCVVSTCIIPCALLQHMATHELPGRSVTWTTRKVTIYIAALVGRYAGK